MTREHSPPMDVITDMRSSPPEQFLPEPPSPTSSEPALFSSDDPVEAEDVNNYASPRTKRKHVGPWWHAAVDTPGPAKKSKNMERNFDSAVWMWSDEFDESDELPTLLDREPEPDLTDIAFHNIVQNGISQGQLSYDLSKYGAEDYHLHNLDALTSVIRNPPDPGNELPAEGQYRSMIPQLVLFLSRNRLKYLALNLFQLEYVTHLVLSHNCIEVLSPCIGQMQNLEALDVSHNRLTYLPREICQLLSPQGNLEQLNVHGNPLLELVDDTSYSVMARQIFSRIHSREGLLQTLYNTVERKDLQDPSAPFFATLISCLESRIRNDRTERHLASRSDVLPSRLTYVHQHGWFQALLMGTPDTSPALRQRILITSVCQCPEPLPCRRAAVTRSLQSSRPLGQSKPFPRKHSPLRPSLESHDYSFCRSNPRCKT
jgi:hypothetical protein